MSQGNQLPDGFDDIVNEALGLSTPQRAPDWLVPPDPLARQHERQVAMAEYNAHGEAPFYLLQGEPPYDYDMTDLGRLIQQGMMNIFGGRWMTTSIEFDVVTVHAGERCLRCRVCLQLNDIPSALEDDSEYPSFRLARPVQDLLTDWCGAGWSLCVPNTDRFTYDDYMDLTVVCRRELTHDEMADADEHDDVAPDDQLAACGMYHARTVEDMYGDERQVLQHETSERYWPWSWDLPELYTQLTTGMHRIYAGVWTVEAMHLRLSSVGMSLHATLMATALESHFLDRDRYPAEMMADALRPQLNTHYGQGWFARPDCCVGDSNWEDESLRLHVVLQRAITPRERESILAIGTGNVSSLVTALGDDDGNASAGVVLLSSGDSYAPRWAASDTSGAGDLDINTDNLAQRSDLTALECRVEGLHQLLTRERESREQLETAVRSLLRGLQTWGAGLPRDRVSTILQELNATAVRSLLRGLQTWGAGLPRDRVSTILQELNADAQTSPATAAQAAEQLTPDPLRPGRRLDFTDRP